MFPEYAKMQAEVAGTAGRINGAFGHLDWTPIRYINRTIKRSTLAGLYRMSDVGLVTPLRDGMNLVAKEFVAAQDGDDPGALVLSRFAGSAPELSGALIINPYDLDGTGNAIARALSMPREDRIARWREMFDRLMKNGRVAMGGPLPRDARGDAAGRCPEGRELEPAAASRCQAPAFNHSRAAAISLIAKIRRCAGIRPFIAPHGAAVGAILADEGDLVEIGEMARAKGPRRHTDHHGHSRRSPARRRKSSRTRPAVPTAPSMDGSRIFSRSSEVTGRSPPRQRSPRQVVRSA